MLFSKNPTLFTKFVPEDGIDRMYSTECPIYSFGYSLRFLFTSLLAANKIIVNMSAGATLVNFSAFNLCEEPFNLNSNSEKNLIVYSPFSP